MKKHLLFLFTALTLLLVPTALRAQTTVQVGFGTGTHNEVPYSNAWAYSFVEQVYPASEIGMPSGGHIKSISFKMQSTTATLCHISVYLKNVSRSGFNSNTDFETLTGATLIYSGNFMFVNGWNTIPISSPFFYDGTSNLMVAFHEDNPSLGDGLDIYTTDATNATIRFVNDNQDINVHNPGTGSTLDFRANIQLQFTNTVTIGSGSSATTVTSGPYASGYNYSFTETIYTADVIGIPAGGTINAIRYHVASGRDTSSIKVYMKNVYTDGFSPAQYETVTPSDLVYQGDVIFASGWVTIPLNTPFVYDGISNLMIAVDENSSGRHTVNFFQTQKELSTITFYHNSLNPDPYNLPSYTGYKMVSADRSDIMIDIIPNPNANLPTTVTVGNEAETRGSGPFAPVFNYSFTESIYTADEIGIPTGGTISAIRYHVASGDHENNITVYMKSVNRFMFSSSEYETVTASDIVYQGNVTFSSGWVTINLTNPFVYDGTRNLMIAVDENSSGNELIDFYCSPRASAIITFYHNSQNPDPYNLSSFTGLIQASEHRPDIQLDIAPNPSSNMTVNDGTETNTSVPVHGFFTDNYLKAEFVMPAATLNYIGTGREINSMTFYTSNSSSNISWANANFLVFMKEVGFTTFDYFTGTSGATVVYQGSLSIVDGQMKINFTTPYTYHGGNLLIGVYNTAIGSYTSCIWAGVYATNASVYGHSSTSLSSVQATPQNFLPKTTFGVNTNIDFELGNMNMYPFHNSTSYPWKVVNSEQGCTNGSNYCMRSGNSGVHNSTSAIEMTYNFTSNGNIAFDARCQGEGTSTFYDHCDFLIDGVVKFTHGADLSGWNHFEYPVSPGNHTFKWTYTKDGSVNSEIDAFLVDNIEFNSISCSAPTNLAVSDITSATATLNWAESGTATEWQICLNGNMANLINVTEKPYTLTGLTPETSYTVKVRANCGSNGTSEWSTVKNFTTAASEPLVQIGEGTNTSYYVPTYTQRYYSLTEQIYTASEIGQSGDIYTIAFYNANFPVIRNLNVYMVNTNKSSFSDQNDWVAVSPSNLVFSGDVSMGSENWFTIELTNPFHYSGSGNLLIVVDDNTEEQVSSNFFRVFDAPNQARSIYGYNTDYDPSSPESYSGEVLNVKNQIKLGFEPPVCPRPTNLTASNIGSNSATLSWTENGTATEWQILFAGDMANFITTTDNPYELTGLTPETNYRVIVRPICGGDDGVINWSTEINFTTTAAQEPLVQIGDGTDTHYALPTDVYYNYSLTEQIYTAAEIGRNGDIYTLAFYNEGNAVTRNLNIYMVNTNKSSFSDGTDWVAVSSSDLVFSGELEFLSNEWTTIELTNPFHYSGTDNLLIVVDDNTGDYVDAVPFLSFDATSQALTIFNDDIDFNPFAPGAYTGEVEYQKNQIQLGFEPTACQKPTNLAVPNYTSNSADLQWTGTGNTYTVKYRPSSVIFSDDFENGLGQWTQIDADGDGYLWGRGSELLAGEFVPHGGSDIACSQSYDNLIDNVGLSPNNYLVTPQVSLGGTVSFWAKAQHPDYPYEHFGIAVSTSGNMYASDFTTIEEWTMDAGDWQQFTVDLSGFAGETGYVALRHFGCTDEYLLDIDDFTIYGPEEPWQTTTTSTASIQLTGLTPGTGYEVQVQSNCGSDGTSNWSDILTFNTATPSCPTPTDLAVSNITDNSAMLSWTENGTATEWQICLDGDEDNLITVTNNHHTLTGLTQETSYSVKVRAKCSSNNVSDWSIVESFSTTGEIIPSDFIDFETNDFSQHPFNQDAFYPWVIANVEAGCDNGSNYCMKSGNEGIHSSTSTIEATHEFSEDGYITFDAKCMGEGETYDVCEFYIDGDLKFSHGDDLGGWYNYTFDVTAGSHTFTWSYTKDHSVNPDGDAFFVDNIEFGTSVSCPAPMDLTVTNTTKHTAELSWMENGSATEWQIMVNYEEANIIDVYNNPYILENLDAYTEYTVVVRANCGNGVFSDWSNEAHIFTEIGCPATEDLTTMESTVSTATLTWTGEGESFNLQYRVVGEDWIEVENVLPPYLLEGLMPSTNYEVVVVNNCGADGLSFESNLAVFTTLDCPAPMDLTVTNTTKHTAELSWTENASATEWQIMVNYNEDDLITVNSNSYILENLNAGWEYIAVVRANCGGNAWSFWSNEVHILTEIGCSATNDLTTMESTVNSATLTWTGEGESFNLQYRAVGEEWTEVENVFPPYLLEGLMPSTNYEVQVQNNCGTDGQSDWSNLATFTTSLCPMPSGLEVTNITKHTADLSWTENGSATEWQISLAHGSDIDIITVTGTPSYTLTNLDAYTEYTVMVQSNCDGSWSGWGVEGSFITQVGCQASNNLLVESFSYNTATLTWTGEGETFNLRYRTPGNEWMMTNNVVSPYELTNLQSNTDYEVQVQNNCGTDGLSDWSNLATFTTSLCPAPSGLEASNITKHTADLSWTENGSASEWQILVTSGEVNTFTVTDNPYTLTGLAPYTEYTVQVRANCGGTWSDWSNEEHFITPIGCPATNDLDVIQTSYYFGMISWTGEGETFNVRYRVAGGEWDTVENVVSFYKINGLTPGTDYEAQVQNNCGTDGLSDWSNLVTFTTLICPTPTGLTVTNVTNNSAVISWTENGTATVWQLHIDNHYIGMLDVYENPYTLTGLNAGAEYTVQVVAYCGAVLSDLSEELTFTTDIACHATGDLHVIAVTPNSATLDWTGEGDAFEMQYKTGDGEWVLENNVTPPYTLTGLVPNTYYEVQVRSICTGYGVSEWSNTATFATSLCPAPTSLTISNITKNSAVLSWTETGTATAWKISIDNHYMNLFDVNENPYTLTGLSAGTEYTVKVSAICGASWSDWSNEVTFTTEVACLPTEDLAVTDYTYNTATLNWTGEGNVFHIRHRVPGGEWVATDGIVPPYTLTDLNPGTTYEAQVKNECAGGNQSEWSNLVTFTTSACDPQAIPYAYNFETEEPFYCWRHVTGDVELIQALPSHNHTPNGQYSMAFYESASDVIAFPQFTQEVNTLQVSFWVRPHNSTFSGNGTFAVGYLTDVNDASTFTAVSTYNYNDWPASMDFLRKIVTLQDAPAGAVIAFRHDSPTENGTWYVDDIVVSAICDVPTGIAVSNITNQSATVTWTDNGAAAWTLALNSMENYVPNITTNQYTFTGLTPGMTYSVKVRSRCGDDILSNWSEQVIFTTLSNSIPTYATITGDSTVCHLSTTILTANTDVPATYLWSNGATTKQINVGAGTYQVTVTSATGNELVSEPFTLTEKQTFATDDSRSICPSELPYTWNGHTFQETGMAFVTLTASNGCDSIVTMVLTVNPTYSVTEERTVCPSALPYTWNGISFSGPAMKYVTLPTVNGCDSMVTMVLSVSDAYEVTVTRAVCSSELPIVWNGKTFNTAGTQMATLTASNGCDSIVTMVLTVNTPVNTAITVSECGSYTWAANGQTYTTSGEYTYSHQDANGCTQVDTLHLTINNPVNTAISVSECGSYTWAANGQTYTTSGEYTYSHQDANGCTQVDTLHLTINNPVNTAISVSECGSYTWAANGQTYSTSGEYTYSHQDANGCTQVDTLHLTINNPVNTAITVSECGSYTWTANGQTYSTSGEYTYSHQDAHGCTQVDTLYLTINNPVNTAITVSECGSYIWAANGQTYSTSGEYTYSHQDANGCTQVDTLHLTINNPVNTAISVSECGSYTWAANGQTYTTSGEYTYSHQDANGCTQVDTLYLTINNPVNTAISVSECGSYTWAANGQTYTTSGEYTYSHQDANGCTQVDTLYLTINNPVNTAISVSECGSYTWAANGQTYTTSGEYTYSHQDAHGCTQVDTLYLTINNPVNTAITVSECGSYTWAANGQTYSTSGEYTYSHQVANGCTQVDTLHLTINNATSSEFTIETADSCYTWNGQTYCASGDYVQTLQTVNGCDSVVTLHLTTRVGVTVHEVEKVFLAPNPTKHICRIMGLETEPVSVDLYDMRGKLVMKASDREFDVTMLPTGLYMVKIYTGDRFINLKLVKQ